MKGALTAIRFVKGSTIGPVWQAPRWETTLEGAVGPMDADVYEPPGSPRGAIVFVHGMTFRGHRDPRQMRACSVLAGSGYRVVAPLIQDLATVRVSLDGLEQVSAALGTVAARPDLCGGSPPGVFSVSYSAALCLIAAARPELEGRVAALCALGTYSDGPGWVRWIIEDEHSDPYARLIVLRNFLPGVMRAPDAVLRALDATISDLNAGDEPRRLPAVWESLSEDERALTRSLREDPATWRRVGQQILDAGLTEVFGAISPAAAAPRLSMPVALIHGATDQVIPPEESRDLHGLLAARGAPSRLTVTRLLTHGDAELSLHVLREASSLLGTFAHFFGAIPAPLVSPGAGIAPSRSGT